MKIFTPIARSASLDLGLPRRLPSSHSRVMHSQAEHASLVSPTRTSTLLKQVAAQTESGTNKTSRARAECRITGRRSSMHHTRKSAPSGFGISCPHVICIYLIYGQNTYSANPSLTTRDYRWLVPRWREDNSLGYSQIRTLPCMQRSHR